VLLGAVVWAATQIAANSSSGKTEVFSFMTVSPPYLRKRLGPNCHAMNPVDALLGEGASRTAKLPMRWEKLRKTELL
jgi:hypothetical protein